MQGSRLGPYRLDELLGEGGMARVHAATVVGDGAAVPRGERIAVKVLRDEVVDDPAVIARFEREVRLGASVHHDNLVRTYGGGVAHVDGRPVRYLAMELVEGQTLRAMLTELERLPEDLCRHVALEVVRGLAALHAAGVVHRDVKPENVLVTSDNQVKLMDLGLAGSGQDHDGSEFVGSLAYSAPEHIRGEDIDGRADLFAVGVLSYELATGVHPFDAPDLPTRLAAVLSEPAPQLADVLPRSTPFFQRLVGALLAKEPSGRFESSETLARVLEQAEMSAWWAANARDASPAGSATYRPRTPRSTSLVGRDVVMQSLWDAYETARGGKRSVIYLHGEAGIGKTRVIDEFLDGVGADSRPVLRLMGAWSGGQTSAYAPLGAALATIVGSHIDVDTLVRLAPGRGRVLHAVAALLRGDTVPDDDSTPSSDAVAAVVADVLTAASAQAPLILVLEDVHNAPLSTRFVAQAIGQAVRHAPVLIVYTSRRVVPEELLPSFERDPHAEQIELARLGPKDVGRMLVESLHSQSLAEQIGYRVLVRSDGNPLFVLEILRSLRESGAIVRDPDGSWVRTATIRDIGIPETVRDLIAARVADIADEDRELLDVAACLATRFDPLLVGAVVGLGRVEVLRQLARIERSSQIVRGDGVDFVFEHEQIRRALHEQLGPLMRREIHGALAGAYERHREERGRRVRATGEAAAFLAHHHVRSATPHRAGPYVDSAARCLRDVFRFEAAAKLLWRALDVPRLGAGRTRLRWLTLLAECHRQLGRVDAEADAVSEAVAVAECREDPAGLARAHTLRGRMHFVAGRLSDARIDLESAVHFAAQADEADADAGARAVLALGQVLRAQGDLDASDAAFARALEQARRCAGAVTML